jgi:hypothetical protein
MPKQLLKNTLTHKNKLFHSYRLSLRLLLVCSNLQIFKRSNLELKLLSQTIDVQSSNVQTWNFKQYELGTQTLDIVKCSGDILGVAFTKLRCNIKKSDNLCDIPNVTFTKLWCNRKENNKKQRMIQGTRLKLWKLEHPKDSMLSEKVESWKP